jgi:DNA-binding NarL/FixJ family response regulator
MYGIDRSDVREGTYVLAHTAYTTIAVQVAADAPYARPVRTMARVRVLIAEDFPPFRRFIISTLAKCENLQVVCEVSDGLEAVQKAEELKPDLIMLDVGLPSLNGIEAARQICKLLPQAKIIFVTQQSSRDTAREALNVGAKGYVLKTSATNDVQAIKAVLDGRQFFSDGLIGY